MCSPNEHSFIISADCVPIIAFTSCHAPQQRGLETGAPLIPGPAAPLRRGKAPVRSTPRIAGSQMAPYSEPNICRSSELLSYTIGSYTQRKIDWQGAKNMCFFFYWGLQLLWAFCVRCTFHEGVYSFTRKASEEMTRNRPSINISLICTR